ncbi:MAG: putative amidophosphoribosyltransferase [Verrucomicrobiales bacterium]|nr:putative amidophosphoribosyltransferase [Verrucomicrobiales bacterium]
MTFVIPKRLRPWLDQGLNFFYPALCQICRKNRAGADESFICASCVSGKDGVHFLVPPYCDRCCFPFEGDISNKFECSNCREVELHFRYARSAVVTSPLLLDVIHRWKYNRALWFEPFLAELLIREAAPALREEKWDLIVPVPLHSKKEREREFNQAERLARHLSHATTISVNKDLLTRAEFTLTQTQLTREQRAENVRRAFTMKGGKKLNGEKIILLDDVLTTGATTNACAKVLREAGASEVCVWTVARARG